MSRSFIKLAAASLVVLGFAGSALAQSGSSTTMMDNPDIIRPITAQGSAAFVFTVSGLGSFGVAGNTLSDGTGTLMGAGVKYYLSDGMALRGTLAFGNSSTSTPSPNSITSTTTSMGIGAGIEWHTHPVYSTSPFFGAQIGYGSSSSDNGASGPADVKSSTHQFGLNAFAGFDWFFTRGLAVGAEYGLGFASTSGSTTTNGIETDAPSSTGIGIMSGGNMHLVVYF